ncbi:putative F420-dependent oxidoreductase [Kribbella sp. VKM Ac-2569]|uniref:TIGR03619 family F420-dependent LLM class oxidoreductase n=1 Tax=Kribbella sp. VKM Ac-2569 TaxID=2512220 RepID=UPI00102C15AB|nr:TIGR03619 family F420-dependent LLM class oxidoreductase [Kribbella sp. VKM Ac-2569]RZT17015.1 putative F420-dependent oxidoreductase [Kribbella sp. VKM Ac-2569]
MTYPEVGVGLPLVGLSGPEAVVAIATAADELGFAAVSVFERLLIPAAPDWVNHAGLPEQAAYDALETLTYVAARTSRVRLHTAVLVPLFQQPVVLARRVATIDQLSGGRMDLGLALGWLPEEFVATGVPSRGRVAAFEESVAVLRACWGPDPVEFSGEHYTVPMATIGPKPVAPLMLYGGGVTQPAIERAARIADGLTLAHRDWESTCAAIAWYHQAGGTGPIILRAGPMQPHPMLEGPVGFTPATIVDDLRHAADEGVTRVDWDLNIIGTPIAEQLAALERLAGRLYG